MSMTIGVGLLKYRKPHVVLAFAGCVAAARRARLLSWPKYRLFLERNPLAIPGRITDLIALSRSV